ncbi:Uncharacterised protein [Shewanella baltica]|nr:Uncharacterised protein [Shewanella baltica]
MRRKDTLLGLRVQVRRPKIACETKLPEKTQAPLQSVLVDDLLIELDLSSCYNYALFC